jgi:prephenate dehydrogenase
VELANSRITIIGLGLMGGSLALDLLEQGMDLSAVDANPQTIKLARRAGIRTLDLGTALTSSDVLVLATPVRETIKLLEAFRINPPALELVMDLGSTKKLIVEAMEALPGELAAVGGHPLCGKELSGFTEAQVGLFKDQRFVLTPCSSSTPHALATAEKLIEGIGATPIHMDAARHDMLLGTASHLPYLLAMTLMGAAEALGDEEAGIWDVVSSGFLSTSRLAASDLTMMVDILATNRDMSLSALSRAQAKLDQLRGHLAAGDTGALRSILQPLQERRRSLQVHLEQTHGA